MSTESVLASRPKPLLSKPAAFSSALTEGMQQMQLGLEVPSPKPAGVPFAPASTPSHDLMQRGVGTEPSILIFSGGSAVSSFVPMLQSFTENICYCMPVSDDGGSTSEIVKVVGGPAIGDIRSRLLGLADTSTPEAKAVYKFLAHRLPAYSNSNMYSTCPAKAEWLSILEGNHTLWNDIPVSHQYSMRAFLFQFNDKVLKETCGTNIFSMTDATAGFDFRGASIGNIFLTGCRLFFHSLEAAIFQFAQTVYIPKRTFVLPVISTNHLTVSIGVTLRNGSSIFGQCEISHPGATVTVSPTNHSNISRRAIFEISSSPGHDVSPSGNVSVNATTAPHRLKRPASSSFNKKFNLSSSLDFGPLNWTKSTGSLKSNSSLSNSNLFFSKSQHEIAPLVSPIRRVYYINSDNQETFPKINPLLPRQFDRKKTIIYGMGSLYTSLLPCLVVPGIGGLITEDFGSEIPRTKILLLNGTHDRETDGFTAMDFILAITDTLNYSVIAERGGGEVVKKVMTKRDAATDMDGADQVWRWRGALVGTSPGGIGFTKDSRRNSVVSTYTDELDTHTSDSFAGDHMEEEDELEQEISEMKSSSGRGYLIKPYGPSAFITHMLYTENSLVPVEVEDITALGIQCICVPKSGTLNGTSSGDDGARPVERGSSNNVSGLAASKTAGYFGVEELKTALAPLLE
ncbi:hypothetical protein BC830DRAFT_1252112 [Chytriomyces sp. MP71]|nr:hypothetical protein BC830DRAFT_1252112 [Chytriomyces sp. MP71]